MSTKPHPNSSAVAGLEKAYCMHPLQIEQPHSSALAGLLCRLKGCPSWYQVRCHALMQHAIPCYSMPLAFLLFSWDTPTQMLPGQRVAVPYTILVAPWHFCHHLARYRSLFPLPIFSLVWQVYQQSWVTAGLSESAQQFTQAFFVMQSHLQSASPLSGSPSWPVGQCVFYPVIYKWYV